MDKPSQKEQTVIDMSDYHPETGYAALAQVEAYWTALKGENLLPKRAEIDPRGIEQALENTFILERVAPGIARVRIAGQHLNDLMGMEVRGMPLTALFTPPARRDIADLLEEVFQTPARSSLRLKSEVAPNRPPLDARMVLLPLRSDLGDVSRILGCLLAKGDIGLTPRRFEIAGIDTVRVGIDPRDPERETSPQLPVKITPAQVPVRAFAERQTPFDGQTRENTKSTRPATRPPYLRLVRSDD